MHIDPGQLEHVLLNLAANARDAMAAEGGVLTIATRLSRGRDPERGEELGERDWGVVSVSDTGHGMDAETRARIFEPFFTTKPPGRGTGLGLATVHGTVHQSGGHLEVESAPGLGTTISVLLPLLHAAAPAGKEPGREVPQVDDLRGDEALLLVEDDAAVRRVAATGLRSFGYTVHEASEAEEGVLLARRLGSALRCLVTDVVLPGANGGGSRRSCGTSGRSSASCSSRATPRTRSSSAVSRRAGCRSCASPSPRWIWHGRCAPRWGRASRPRSARPPLTRASGARRGAASAPGASAWGSGGRRSGRPSSRRRRGCACRARAGRGRRRPRVR